MKHWLTSSDLAEYLSVQEEQVMAWVARNEVPFHRKFGLLRFFRPEIDDWMRGREISRQDVAPPGRPPGESDEDLDTAGPSFLTSASTPMAENEARRRAPRMGRPGWGNFLERHFGRGRFERLGRSEALIDGRSVRVQVSKLYEENENFRGRDCWWFDIPETYFTEEETEALLLLGQRESENTNDFVVFRCPRGQLPREQLDRVEVNDRVVRRVHIDASDYRDLRKEVVDFSRFLQASPDSEGQKGQR